MMIDFLLYELLIKKIIYLYINNQIIFILFKKTTSIGSYIINSFVNYVASFQS